MMGEIQIMKISQARFQWAKYLLQSVYHSIIQMCVPSLDTLVQAVVSCVCCFMFFCALCVCE